VSLGQEVFTDLDFAEDVSIIAEMLEVLIFALEIMNEESLALGLEIKWNKMKIQASDIIVDAPPAVTILGHKVDVVDTFVHLGSSVDASGGNDSDIRRRTESARTCTKSLDRGIWRSSISLFHQAQALQCLYSSGAPIWFRHMECERSIETTS